MRLLLLAALLTSTSVFSAEGRTSLTVSATIVDSCAVSSKDVAVLVRCGNGVLPGLTSQVIPEISRTVTNDGITIITITF